MVRAPRHTPRSAKHGRRSRSARAWRACWALGCLCRSTCAIARALPFRPLLRAPRLLTGATHVMLECRHCARRRVGERRAIGRGVPHAARRPRLQIGVQTKCIRFSLWTNAIHHMLTYTPTRQHRTRAECISFFRVSTGIFYHLRPYQARLQTTVCGIRVFSCLETDGN